MKKTFTLIRVVAVVALIFLLMISSSFFYTVAPNEYGVVMHLGRITRVSSEAGFYSKLPFFETVRFIPKDLQIYDIQPSDVITKDKKSMIADDFILWKVTDPVKFTQTLNASTRSAEDRVGVAVYNATKNILSSMSQDEVIAARGEQLTKLITEDSNSDIGGYGITIYEAKIKALDLPDDNKDAVYERMISERQNIAASYKAQGDSQAQKIRNDTNRQVTIMEAEAKKQAAITEAEGEAEYMKTLSEAYNTTDKADFYNYIRSLDALKNSMKGRGDKTIILDKDSEIAKILYGTGLH
ncbi:protease modulator HflC [Oribacterium sp. C9]|uniref:protease modulator HflC n=1 Tax=Oribacterium sp. C9 TaxID=1943579 RepID=UPI00098EA104|nr:protease modulator HflC [Oribacterium sp. C9]OON86526.1 protease modulator HflC [Oribacterium sp. C9]